MRILGFSFAVTRFFLVTISLLVLDHVLSAQEIKQGVWKGNEIEYIDGQLCVKVREGVTREQIVQIAGSIGSTVGPGPDILRWILVRLPSGVDPFSIIDTLLSNPLIESCEPNVIGYALFDPDDEYYLSHQWPLYNQGDICDIYPPPPYDCCFPGEDINVRKAWDITLGSSTIPIAVLDSGIPLEPQVIPLRLNHPDLDESNRIILGQDFIIIYRSDRETDPTVRDNYGHGTWIAGIIGAQTANDTGIAGVAGSCKLVIQQVMAVDGTIDDMAFKDAVIAAVGPPYNARVINFSAAFTADLDPVEDAIAHAQANGVLVVAAASYNPGNIGWPGELSLMYNNLIAVRGHGCLGCVGTDEVPSDKISVVSPGAGTNWDCDVDWDALIVTTHPSYVPGGGYPAEGYRGVYGSSIAAAHLSGIAGLMLSVNSGLVPSQIRDIAEKTADDKGIPGHDDVYGWGSTNAYQAVLLSLAHASKSHSTTATANSGQRKLVQGTTKRHLVFESGGEVYHRSANIAGSWESATRVSKGTENNSAPCITERDQSVFAVWQRPYTIPDTSPWDVLYSYSTDGGGFGRHPPS